MKSNLASFKKKTNTEKNRSLVFFSENAFTRTYQVHKCDYIVILGRVRLRYSGIRIYSGIHSGIYKKKLLAGF